MKIRLYPVVKDKLIQVQTGVGMDSNRHAFYLMDIEAITVHEDRDTIKDLEEFLEERK